MDHLEDIERGVEAVGLLGVDGQADAMTPGALRQGQQPGRQLAQHPVSLRELVARVERRQLDRDAGPGEHAVARGVRADGVDRRGVGFEELRGVGHGARRLAEHVEGVAVARRLGRPGALQRLADGAAHDELAAQDAHRLEQRPADHRLAAARDQPADDRAGVAAKPGIEADQAAGQHQSPGRGVDEQGLAAPQVALPVGVAELVADQPVGGLAIGNPQQRLGEAHQDDALLARQGVLLEQGVEPAGAAVGGAHLGDQAAGALDDSGARLGPEVGLVEQRLDARGLVGAVGPGDGAAQRVPRRRRRLEDHRAGRRRVRHRRSRSSSTRPAGVSLRPVRVRSAWLMRHDSSFWA